MKLYTLFVAAGLLAACNNNTPSSTGSKPMEKQNDQMKKDAEFMVKIAEANMMEIEMGKVAQNNGASPKVIDFGEMMVNHHSKMLTDLRSLAVTKNIAIPTDLNEDHKEKLNDLAEKHGKDFDEKYVDEMVSDHKKDIKEFEDKIKDDECDPDIKNMLKEGLPVLNHHLNTITEIKQSER
jgi:putative membrane protein